MLISSVTTDGAGGWRGFKARRITAEQQQSRFDVLAIDRFVSMRLQGDLLFSHCPSKSVSAVLASYCCLLLSHASSSVQQNWVRQECSSSKQARCRVCWQPQASVRCVHAGSHSVRWMMEEKQQTRFKNVHARRFLLLNALRDARSFSLMLLTCQHNSLNGCSCLSVPQHQSLVYKPPCERVTWYPFSHNNHLRNKAASVPHKQAVVLKAHSRWFVCDM